MLGGMHAPSFTPADQVAAARLHQAFRGAFADYLLGPFEVALAQWAQFLARQGVDLAHSRVAWQDGEIAAFALAAPRPALGLWRLGTMGALPAARGSGAAPALLDDFVARAEQAGMRGVELECFAQNARALRLYQGRGFAAVHPLYGYRRAGGLPAPASGGDAQPIDLAQAFDRLGALAVRDGALPLQVTPPSLRALPGPLQAWTCGAALLVWSEGPGPRLTLHALVDPQPGQRDAQALLAALLRRHASCEVAVPQLQRPDLGGAALEALGFERLPLHQLLLRRPLG